jgi:RNA polymerase primary sigma factor
MEREEFQDKLLELGTRARQQESRISMEEVRNFFQDMELSEEQYQLIFAYLASCQVTVEGYVAPQPEEEQEEIPLTPEEKHFLESYKQELDYLKPLEKEEILELCRQAEETGDGLAKAKLTEQFLPEVLNQAHEFRGQGLLLGDLVQEGNIGLMLALETLGLRTEGISYRDYLIQEIRSAIAQAVEENRTEKSAGELVADRLNDLSDNIKKLSDELERQVSIEELSAYMDMPVEEIEELLRLAGESSGASSDE